MGGWVGGDRWMGWRGRRLERLSGVGGGAPRAHTCTYTYVVRARDAIYSCAPSLRPSASGTLVPIRVCLRAQPPTHTAPHSPTQSHASASRWLDECVRAGTIVPYAFGVWGQAV